MYEQRTRDLLRALQQGPMLRTGLQNEAVNLAHGGGSLRRASLNARPVTEGSRDIFDGSYHLQLVHVATVPTGSLHHGTRPFD